MKITLKKLFIPSFNELTLFLMGLSFVILFFAEPSLYDGFVGLLRSPGHLGSRDEAGLYLLIWVLVIFIGFGVSSYHVLTRGEKSARARSWLFYYAIMISLLAGLSAFAYNSVGEFGWLMLFPLWNLIAAFVPIWADEDEIGSQEAETSQLLVGVVILCLSIHYLYFTKGLHWSLTFSAAVFYAEVFGSFFVRETGK